MMYTPGYLELYRSGELDERLSGLEQLLLECKLCGHRCGVNRLAGERGWCGAGQRLEVASSCIHRGEEPVLTGGFGVGNIFLGRCNLECIFCQNHTVSQPGQDSPPDWLTSPEELADQLLRFQVKGCPTVGFVSPTHWAPWIFRAVSLAAEEGFALPVIYNTNGYDSAELLTLLDGMVDIYLPDFKYWEERNGRTCSGATDYPETARNALKEMYRQVGSLRTDSCGTAAAGLIVRLLVLPGDVSGTRRILHFIAEELGTDVFVSLMSQYYPAHMAGSYPPLDRKLLSEEYSEAVETLEKLGFENGWIQDPVTSPDSYLPGIDFEL